MCPALNVFIQQGHLISVWHSPVWKRLPPSCSDCTCWFQVEPSALRPCWHYVSSPALVISAPRGFLPRSVQNATLCVFSRKSILVSMETRFANTSSLPNDPVLLLSFSPLLFGSVFFLLFLEIKRSKGKKKIIQKMRSCWFFIAGILNKHMWENTKAWHCNTSFFIKKKTDYDAFSVLSRGGG